MAALNPSRLTLHVSIVVLILLTLICSDGASFVKRSKEGCPSDMPYGCSCIPNPLEVLCEDTQLAQIPEDLPAKINFLIFRGNNFTILDYVPVEYHDVISLELDQNGIRYLRDNCFQDMNQLKHLFLENNHISGIHGQTFVGLTALQLLDLSYNHLYELEEATFDGAMMPNLMFIRIKHSKIYSIHPQTFQHLTNLTELNMSHNAFNLHTPFGDTTSFPNLSTLDLSFNTIGPHLNFSLFQHMPALDLLILTGNRLQTIQSQGFAGLGNSLRVLHLQRNSLHYIEPGTFSHLRKLAEVDLSFNKLQVLDFGSSLGGNLGKLVVHDNPWQCACANAWLVQIDAVRWSNVNLSFV